MTAGVIRSENREITLNTKSNWTAMRCASCVSRKAFHLEHLLQQKMKMSQLLMSKMGQLQ
jgi:hypothetical protein